MKMQMIEMIGGKQDGKKIEYTEKDHMGKTRVIDGEQYLMGRRMNNSNGTWGRYIYIFLAEAEKLPS